MTPLKKEEVYDELFEGELLEEGIENTSTSRTKKILLILSSIIVLIIFITYYTTTPTARSILAGYIESTTLAHDHSVRIPGQGHLYFTGTTHEELLTLFDKNLGKEFKACLQGRITGENYYITSLHVPKMYEQTHDSVTAEPCPEGTLVTLHSHPIQHCLPSEVDFESFKKLKEENENVLLAVMCERDRFTFYD